MKNQQGFSLIEILIALTLLALIGTFVGSKIFDSLRDGKINVARTQMGTLAQSLKAFRLDCGHYPTGENGLQALVEKPSGGKECKRYNPNGYLENEIPLDPWDNEYTYESDGRKFSIKSFGPDGLEGGEGRDEADIIFPEKRRK
ncbi:MAG: type II secretion system major pseudopilin GspG [Bacteriovoracaceae bacterium]|nr:type II secretion system major pseudopilin GspG [Bacteriovoracaceae bacterium]